MNITVPMRARLALLAVAALVIAVLTALPANAALPAAFTWDPTDADPSSELSDGVTVDLGYPDEGSGNDKELGPKNGAATKVAPINLAPLPVLDTSNPNPGTDFTRVLMDFATDGSDLWGYFAFNIEKFSTGQSAWEFMQDPAPPECDYEQSDDYLKANCNPWLHRQAGDFILVADYQGNGVELGYRVWEDDPDGPEGALRLGPLFDITEEYGIGSVDGGSGWVEMAVNITQAVYGGAQDKCLTIGNIIPSTLTGNSDEADYKDVALVDITDYITLQSCGSVKITKILNTTNSYDDLYKYTLDRTGGTMRYADDVTTENPANVDTGYVVPGASGVPGTAVVETKLKAGTDYTLAELIEAGTDGTVSTELVSLVCTTNDGAGTAYTLVDNTPGSTATISTTFPVVAGQTTSCVITNKEQIGTLKVYKTVVNDDGLTATASAFRVDITGPNSYSMLNQVFGDETPSDADPLTGYLEYTVPAGAYAVTEDLADDSPYDFPDGYSTSPTYSYDDGNGPVASCASVVVPAGGTAECYITNADTPASPTASTTQSWVLHDAVTFTGVRAGASDAPTQVTFGLYTTADCTGTPVGTETVTLNADETAATSTGISVSAPGTWYWKIVRPADDYNNAVTYCNETTTITADDDVAGG
ncbi:hypothetical protein [Demequina sp. NBRC 110052]|uniref:hypothetical protein n=1 Tax=Demequina sp. NBRC 110052 TaxID=1570341 RepID=UPI00117DE9D7|nr:hypothetical protein [Demequina sp. NBRC 110052]